MEVPLPDGAELPELPPRGQGTTARRAAAVVRPPRRYARAGSSRAGTESMGRYPWRRSSKSCTKPMAYTWTTVNPGSPVPRAICPTGSTAATGTTSADRPRGSIGGRGGGTSSPRPAPARGSKWKATSATSAIRGIQQPCLRPGYVRVLRETECDVRCDRRSRERERDERGHRQAAHAVPRATGSAPEASPLEVIQGNHPGEAGGGDGERWRHGAEEALEAGGATHTQDRSGGRCGHRDGDPGPRSAGLVGPVAAIIGSLA